MRKIFILFCMFVISIQFCSAKEDKDYTINFNGTKYHLLYSVKNKDMGGYLNEYYKKGETYNIWSEMVAIHHLPNAYSPIDRIKDFKDYLSSMNVPSSLTFDDKKNSALIDFILIKDDSMPIVLEFNIFKYEKSKKCGSVATQYAKRYAATTTMQIEEIKKDFSKNRKKLIKKVEKFNIPQIVTSDIDKCISGIELSKQSKITENNNKLEENAGSNNVEEVLSDNNIIDEKNSAAAEPVTEHDIDYDDIARDNEYRNQQARLKNNDSNENVVEADISIKQDTDDSITEIQKSVPQNESVNIENNTEDNVEQKQVNEGEINPITPKEDKYEQVQKVKKDKKTKKGKNQPKDKRVKDLKYQVSNDKDNFYAVPRTKKELKEQQKQIKKDLKLKNMAYEVKNDKDDAIAKPRSKKEMKQYKKSLKEQNAKNEKQHNNRRKVKNNKNSL